MADNSISGMYRIIPLAPIKPPQPADKERDNREKKRRPPIEHRRQEDDDADDKPVIDEYV